MPLFKDLFPNAKPGDVINDVIKLTRSWYDCALHWDGCRNRTNWVELTVIDDGTEIHCCSTECAEKLIRYAMEARAEEAEQAKKVKKSPKTPLTS